VGAQAGHLTSARLFFWNGLTLTCEFEGREPPDLFFLGSPAKPIRSGIPILRISALRFAIALTISHA
jgi:hypothetical protein